MQSLQEDSSKGYIILGSYSNIEDRLSWHKELSSFIDRKLHENIPVLGICFGHQLMADFYGAKVTLNNGGLSYQGARKVNVGQRSYLFIVAHKYQVTDLPDSFTRLGTSETCKNEIIKHNELPFTGIQAHPEASKHFIKNTLEKCDLSLDEQEDSLHDGIQFIKKFLTDNNIL